MATIWELDFYSRPLLDENNKRRWEVLICEGVVDVKADPARGFRYSKFVANTEVNSHTLQSALEEAMAQAPTPPSTIRYFRYQMQNMIQRACEGVGLPARPSRRTLALQHWLTERNRISLSTRALEKYPGEFLKEPETVMAEAENRLGDVGRMLAESEA